MNEFKILIVEDDPAHAKRLVEGLTAGGYYPEHAATLDAAQEMTDETDYDLILLDRMLQDRDGLELCQHLNRMGSFARIVFFTDMNDPVDHAEGWAAGADDYVPKNTSIETLLARCEIHLKHPTRRLAGSMAMRLIHNDVPPEDQIVVDMNEGLICKAKDLSLMRRGRRERVVRQSDPYRKANIRGMEVSVFLYLLEREGEWVSERELLTQVWGHSDNLMEIYKEHPDSDTGVVHVTVYRLRKKLDTPRSAPEGERGSKKKRLGYCYIEQEDEDGARYRLNVDKQRIEMN